MSDFRDEIFEASKFECLPGSPRFTTQYYLMVISHLFMAFESLISKVLNNRNTRKFPAVQRGGVAHVDHDVTRYFPTLPKSDGLVTLEIERVEYSYSIEEGD